MSPGETRLLTGTALTTTDLQHADFGLAIIGGYRTHDVDAFRRAAIAAVEVRDRALEDQHRNEQELVREIERLNGLLRQAQGAVPPDTVPLAPVPDTAAEVRSASRVLVLAQENAERAAAEARADAVRIVGEARHAAEQLMARAQQEAVTLRERVIGEAETERAQIINDASAEGRRVASLFRALSEEMGVSVSEALAQLSKRVAEWDARAKEAQAPPRATPPAGTPAAVRRSGGQRQASART